MDLKDALDCILGLESQLSMVQSVSIMDGTVIFILAIFLWIAPMATVWLLSDQDGKDPLAPMIGACFFSWPGGLIIWALIKPDPDRQVSEEEREKQKDAQFLYEKKRAMEISPRRRKKLEKLLNVPKDKL